MNQLNIYQELPADHYIMINDNVKPINKSRNFILFNGDSFKMQEIPMEIETVICTNNKMLNDIQSAAWACRVFYAFVLQTEGIYLFNIENNEVLFCKGHSWEFIRTFLEMKIK